MTMYTNNGNEFETNFIVSVDRTPLTAQTFFQIEKDRSTLIKTAKCLIPDCKSILQTTSESHLIRHLRKVHPSKLEEIRQNTSQFIRLSTIYLCVEHVTISGRPLSSIEDSPFRQLLKDRLCLLNQSDVHALSIDSELIINEIHKVANNIKATIRKEVEGKHITLMVDIAGRQHRSILGVSLQVFVDDKVKIFTIMMHKICTRNNEKNLTDILLSTLKDYGISISLVAIVLTDNGSNMIAAINELGISAVEDTDDWYDGDVYPQRIIAAVEANDRSRQLLMTGIKKELYVKCPMSSIPQILPNCDEISVRCGVHTFQLCVNRAFENGVCKDDTELDKYDTTRPLGIDLDSPSSSNVKNGVPINNVIAAARDVVKELRTEVLLICLEQKGIPIPSMDNQTNWFSKFTMVNRLTMT